MTNCQSAYIVVRQEQGNDQNMGVIGVEVFTYVATRVLRNITPNQFEINIDLQDYFVHCNEHSELYFIFFSNYKCNNSFIQQIIYY